MAGQQKRLRVRQQADGYGLVQKGMEEHPRWECRSRTSPRGTWPVHKAAAGRRYCPLCPGCACIRLVSPASGRPHPAARSHVPRWTGEIQSRRTGRKGLAETNARGEHVGSAVPDGSPALRCGRAHDPGRLPACSCSPAIGLPGEQAPIVARKKPCARARRAAADRPRRTAVPCGRVTPQAWERNGYSTSTL